MTYQSCPAHTPKILFLTLALFSMTATRAQCQESSSRTAKLDEKTGPSQNAPATQASTYSPNVNSSYIIGPGDLISINVLHEPEVSQKVPVRMDGKVTVPLIGEIQASGMMPNALQAAIAQKLHDYIKDAEVTVVVEEIKSCEFSVMGEVEHPGSFPLVKPTTVLEGLAQAGGFRDFAKLSKIHILRKTNQGTRTSLPFNYKEVSKGKNDSQNVELQPGDAIIVP